MDRVEKSLVGASEAAQASLPAPWDVTKVYQKDGDELSYRLSKIWKYLMKSSSSSSSDSKWSPSLIQKHLWPLLLNSPWNSIGVAPTGSGKTYSYSIPTLIHACSKKLWASKRKPAILTLVPTRELVQQVAKVFGKVSKAMKRKESIVIIPVSGGIPRAEQKRALAKAETTDSTNVIVVVATPGRLLDLAKDQETHLPFFRWVVLDEADQLAKDGDLGPQVDEILQLANEQQPTDDKFSDRRLILVSATYPDKAKAKFLEWVGKEHILVQVDPVVQQPKLQKKVINDGASHNEDETPKAPIHRNAGSFARIPAHLEQVLHVCSEHKKPRKLLHTLHKIYSNHEGKRSLPLGMVFFSKIEKLKHLSKLLEKEGIASVELHSQLANPKLREQNLAKFSCGQTPLLLATDLAARGIDIPSIEFVIQYDFPGNLQQYIHRCGRAGRSNQKKATIYSFFTRNLQAMAPDLIQLLEANQAWVDNNLRALVGNGVPNGKRSKRKSRQEAVKKSDPLTPKEPLPEQQDSEGEDVDDFPELSAKRIVLKRASHVSDASSASEDEDS